jgi:regulatory protein
MDEGGEFIRASQKAFRLLGIRAHSEMELRRKLKSGKFSSAVVERAIERCRELGYIDDAQFARARARMLASGKLSGNRRIAFDLRERGVSGDIADAAIAEVDEEIAEEERIRRIVEKKHPVKTARGSDEDPSLIFKEKARIIRNLMGRGFSLERIMGIINEREEEGFHDDDGE